jgi:hypothetical protein
MLKRAIALEVREEGVVRNDGLVSSFGDDCEIIQILKELLVVADWKDDGGSATLLIGKILQCLSHGVEATSCLSESRERASSG